MPDASPTSSSKSLPTLVEELWQMVLAYARQETVDPLKTLGRFVIFGVAGSFILGLGLVLLLLAGLRALQTETGTTFTGHWSWAPYGIAIAGGGLVVILAVAGASRSPRRGRQ